MKWILMLAIVCLGSSVTYAYAPEEKFGELLRTASKQWHDKCNVIIGITKEDIDKMRHGQFEENERVKDYLLCICIVSDGISPGLEIRPEVFKKYAPKRFPNLINNFVECFKNVKNCEKPSDGIWNMIKCVYEKDPVNFIIF